MVEGTEKIKKVVSQKTLDAKNIQLSSKGKRTQCKYCKVRVLGIIKHLEKCHLNPKNSPKIEINWEYWEEFDVVKDHLIRNPTTEKMREYNNILAPKGNPQEKFLDEMLSYAKSLPKAHKDKAINQKLDEIFTAGIDVRLLTKEEYIERLKEKVRKGYHTFLFDSLIPITIEEIEKNVRDLW